MPFKTIGIIGPNSSNCSDELYNTGKQLGELLAAKTRFIICGGMGGFMEAVCRGAKSTGRLCCTVGILPGSRSDDGNAWLDLAIPTGLGLGRNVVVVQSSDIIIAAGGGPGTLSELAFAMQAMKSVICLKGFGGFSEWLFDGFSDQYKNLFGANSMDEVIRLIDRHLQQPKGPGS